MVLALTLGLSGGCQTNQKEEQSKPTNSKLEEAQEKFSKSMKRYTDSLAVRGTIGEAAWIEGLRRMSVRGYGLVVGLGKNGSRTCPEKIRRNLAVAIRKAYRLGDSRVGLDHLTPEKMINSLDTAIVLVQGEIGAAALPGRKFDLAVHALEGTETTTLEGGRLYTCDLRYFRSTAPGVIQEGRILASGKGPIMVNPFGQREQSATPTHLREGKIIGGGTNLQPRKVRLVLHSSSYSLARQIQDRINERFGMGETIATADSSSYISLKIPKRCFGKEIDFLALIRHQYLSDEAGFADQRAIALAEEILDAQAPHDNIGLAWEGIGRKARPVIRNLYTHKRGYVSYYAARTGLRLGDRLAVKVLEDHALDSKSMFQMDAIQELGRSSEIHRAAHPLVKLVKSGQDPRARVRAYEGLVKHYDSSLVSKDLDGQFTLDQIPMIDGPPLIYAKVTGHPRIALIGSPTCRTPMMYHHPRGLLTMSAEDGAEKISTVRKTPSGRVSPTTEVDLSVYELIKLLGTKASEDKYGQVVGLGLNYSQVIEVISSLCNDGTFLSDFRLEEPDASDLLRSPQRFPGRPESEL